jgi:hypothetical protein
MGRPYPRSTRTAWSFIPMSTRDCPTPRRTSAAPSHHTFGMRPTTTRLAANSGAPRMHSALEPRRAARRPPACIAMMEATPMTNNSSPRPPSSVPTCSTTAGMCTTQVAIPKPHTRKVVAIPQRAARIRGVGEKRDRGVDVTARGNPVALCPTRRRGHHCGAYDAAGRRRLALPEPDLPDFSEAAAVEAPSWAGRSARPLPRPSCVPRSPLSSPRESPRPSPRRP